MNKNVHTGIALVLASTLIVLLTALSWGGGPLLALAIAAEFLVVGSVVLHAGLVGQREAAGRPKTAPVPPAGEPDPPDAG